MVRSGGNQSLHQALPSLRLPRVSVSAFLRTQKELCAFLSEVPPKAG